MLGFTNGFRFLRWLATFLYHGCPDVSRCSGVVQARHMPVLDYSILGAFPIGKASSRHGFRIVPCPDIGA